MTRVNLNINVHFDEFLLARDKLDHVQAILVEHCKEWSKGLHVWKGRKRDSVPVDIVEQGALARAIGAHVSDHGPTYYMAMRQFKGPVFRGMTGLTEFRGNDSSLDLYVDVDERPMTWIGRGLKLLNAVSIQVFRRRIAGQPYHRWAERVFEALCARLNPLYGHVYCHEEYSAKNMDYSGGGARAMGVDYSRYLPGIYWLNFFGATYRDMIGRDRLLSSPACWVKEVDDGVLVALHDDPLAWDTIEYKRTERAVLDHLGHQFFFSRESPNRPTVAPAFDVPPRPTLPEPD